MWIGNAFFPERVTGANLLFAGTMRFYLFKPQCPISLDIFESEEALDECLGHDYTKGEDWDDTDIVLDCDGRKGSISYNGTFYEFSMGDEIATAEELRAILHAHLTAVGWKSDDVSRSISSADTMEHFDSVLAEFPPKESSRDSVIGCLILVGFLAFFGAIVWGVSTLVWRLMDG